MTGSGPIIPAGIRDVVRLYSGLSIRTAPQSNVMLYLNTLILQLPYKDKTLGTQALKLVKPTDYKAKRLKQKTWHNPYTEKGEVKEEKERIKRESLFSYDHIGERRPGSHDLRDEVILRDGPICAWCKKEFHLFEVQVDHIKARARFKNPMDADRMENMQVLCTIHHRAKTKADLEVLSRMR
jgi:5-methylcytosine-specific restriction endonuclease McrA